MTVPLQFASLYHGQEVFVLLDNVKMLCDAVVMSCGQRQRVEVPASAALLMMAFRRNEERRKIFAESTRVS